MFCYTADVFPYLALLIRFHLSVHLRTLTHVIHSKIVKQLRKQVGYIRKGPSKLSFRNLYIHFYVFRILLVLQKYIYVGKIVSPIKTWWKNAAFIHGKLFTKEIERQDPRQTLTQAGAELGQAQLGRDNVLRGLGKLLII